MLQRSKPTSQLSSRAARPASRGVAASAGALDGCWRTRASVGALAQGTSRDGRELHDLTRKRASA